MRLFTLAAALLLAASSSSASRLESRIRKLIAKSPAGQGSFAGVLVVDQNHHKLAALNEGRLFVPASNTKLFSTALALERLGPDKRFETRIEQRGRDLVLVGSGDANLSGRTLPYVPDSPPGAPLQVIDELAAQVAAAGIHAVEGDIIGDDSAFLYQPFAPRWNLEDIVGDDGAPVSALVVNDNAIRITITPGPQDGAPAQIAFDPPLGLMPVTAAVITGSPEEIHTDRLPESGQWRVWGTIAAASPPDTKQPYTEQWAVPDPALFAAAALKYSLQQHGITVAGSARAAHRIPGLPFTPAQPGAVIARHQSLPLVEDLRLTLKISQNLHADLLLSDVAGSRSDGLRELAGFLTGIGIPPDDFRFYDGSGLSRANLVTPAAVVALLDYMARSPHHEEWMTLLPVSGVDGSLEHRLTGKKTLSRIRAKTGSLRQVSALSGYALTRKGKQLTFSIFLNNTTASVTAQHDLIDKICEVLVQ